LNDDENYWALQVEIQELAVRAWAALAAGKKEEALRQMKSAAEMEDGTEKSAVTPGPLAPARELLGEMLLQMNQPAQALEQFEATLKKEPGRFRALYGAAHAAQLSGNRDASERYFRELLKVCARADKPGRPELADAAAGDFAELVCDTRRVSTRTMSVLCHGHLILSRVRSVSSCWNHCVYLPVGTSLQWHPNCPMKSTRRE
jgi:tetratricopeptide (TPR) repeat protein